MQHAQVLIVGALALSLLACHGTAPALHGVVTPRGSAAPAAIATSQPPTPGPGPQASGMPTPAPAHLQPANTVTLRGLVLVDAAYVIGNNGGSLISDNGGQVLAVGSAARAAQRAVFTAGALAPGTTLPAAGMQVEARSLATGQPIGVGADATGAIIYTAMTDQQGHYELALPADASGNFYIGATIPGDTDPRDRYAGLQAPVAAGSADPAQLDPDTSATVALVRSCIEQRLRGVIVAPDRAALDKLIQTEWGFPPELGTPFLTALGTILDAAQAAGVATAPPERITAAAGAAADALLARIDLGNLKLASGEGNLWHGPAEPTLPAFTAIYRQLRDLAAAKLAADPAYFDQQPYLVQLNVGRAAAAKYRILRPADLCDLVGNAYLAVNPTVFDQIYGVWDSVGSRKNPETGFDQVDRLEGAVTSITFAVGGLLVVNEHGERDEAIARMRSTLQAGGEPTTAP